VRDYHCRVPSAVVVSGSDFFVEGPLACGVRFDGVTFFYDPVDLIGGKLLGGVVEILFYVCTNVEGRVIYLPAEDAV